MHLAILVTNTDESAFADRHTKDGEKFTALIHEVRPDWKLSVFEVKDGEFPEDAANFDGLIVTGSPASVHDEAAWIDRLKVLLVDAHASGQSIFGACFGHQAIAEALGGEVGDNPTGWELGTIQAKRISTPSWETHLPETLNLYAAHNEQVLRLPKDAQVIHEREGCRYAGYRIGNQIYSTQYHPEMEHYFIEDLTEDMSAKVPKEVIDRSRKSLNTRSHYTKFAESIARFFEQANNN